MINKICTSKEQSEMLIKLGIPIESADGYWDFQIDGYKLIADKLGYYKNDSEIPCWSLAALQDIIKINYKLEKTLFDQSDYFTYSLYDSDEPTFRTFEYDNPVDACVEMIIKLHEQNLL